MQFTELEYLNILEKFRAIIVNFDDVMSQKPKKAYLRHDIEVDLEKAVYLASLNHSKSVTGTFTIQVVSDFYNIHSSRNLNLIKKISNYGQQIGLHYYSEFRDDKDFNFQDFNEQHTLLNAALKKLEIEPFKVFSYHRPTAIQLEASRDLLAPKGFIDCYSPKYFEYTANPTKAKIKYMSDSDHEWRYGHPLEENLNEFSTFQILMHPEEWPIPSADGVYDSILDAAIERTKCTLEIEYRKYSK